MTLENETTRISTVDEEHTRIRLPLDSLKRYAKLDAALWALAACHADDPSSDPIAKLPEHRGSLGWIDVSCDAPTDFTFGGLGGPARGFSPDLNEKRLTSFPSEVHAVGLMLDVMECRDSNELLYHQIEQTIRRVHRVYRRLLAPFAGANGRVDRVYFAVRWIVEPVTLVHAQVR